MSDILKDKRILLVDDDNDILTSLQAAFETTGAIIESASLISPCRAIPISSVNAIFRTFKTSTGSGDGGTSLNPRARNITPRSLLKQLLR